MVSSLPEIAGDNWQAGRDLFKGKATCAACHQLRCDGVVVGPDLGNQAAQIVFCKSSGGQAEGEMDGFMLR